MNRKIFVLSFFLIFLFPFIGSSRESGLQSGRPESKIFRLADVTQEKFTGDLDGMIERRLIRVLVTYCKTHFFVDKGTQLGIVHDLFSMFESDLNRNLRRKNVRVHVVFIPVARDEIIEALMEGRGDVAAANLTISPERLEKVDFTDPLITNIREIVVTGPGVDPVTDKYGLSGKEIYILKSSSFHESVKKLNEDLEKAGKKPVKVRPAPEELETEDILEMVNAGVVGITIADSHIAGFWEKIFDGITLNPEAVLASGRKIGIMIRKNSPLIKAELNEFLGRYPEGSKSRNLLLQKYLRNTKFAREVTSREDLARFEAIVDLFLKYAGKYDLDHLMVVAQGYQESRLDHNARSPAGAIGIMQLLESTGKEMRVGDIYEIGPNIHAGVKYLRFMMDHYYADESIDPLNRGLFAIASYNAGPGRVSRLRTKAAERGLDPNIWFNHVEVVAAEKVGRETVQYVSNIYKYYLTYRMIVERAEKREKVISEMVH